MGFDLTPAAVGGADLITLHGNHPAPTAALAPFSPGPRVVRSEKGLSVLQELTEQNMMLVRSLVRQTTPVMDDLKWPAPRIQFAYDFDAIAGFTQLSRSVRQTVMLQMRIDNDISGLLADGVPSRPLPDFPPPPQGCLPRPRKDLAAFRETVRRNVLEAIRPGYEEDRDEDQAQALRRRLDEHLGEGRRFEAYLNLDLFEAITAICLDLGFTPDWNRWDGETWKPPRGPPAPLSPGDQFIEDQLVAAGARRGHSSDETPDQGQSIATGVSEPRASEAPQQLFKAPTAARR